MTSLLLADDKAVARRTLLSILEGEFHDAMTCIEVENGVDAVDKAQTIHPDVALVDLVMPGLNGLKAAQRIVDTCPETKVLVISMYDPNPLYDKLKEAGVRGFVPKESAGVQLVPAIETLLRGKTFFGLPCSLSEN